MLSLYCPLLTEIIFQKHVCLENVRAILQTTHLSLMVWDRVSSKHTPGGMSIHALFVSLYKFQLSEVLEKS